LCVEPAQNELSATFFQRAVQGLQEIKPGGVERYSLGHVEDEHTRWCFLLLKQCFQFADRGEEQRTIHAIRRNALLAVGAAECARTIVVFQGNALDLGQFRHAIQVEQAGKDHAEFDSQREVEDDGHNKRREQDGAIRNRIAM